MNQREEQIFVSIIEILKKNLNPTKLILFGSRAKGKSTSGSDFDIAVVSDPVNNINQRKVKEAIEAVSGLYKVDVVYWDELDEDFKKIISKSGKVIYERRA